MLKFERPDGMITEAKISDHWHPLSKVNNTNDNVATYKPAKTLTYSIRNANVFGLGSGDEALYFLSHDTAELESDGFGFENGTIWLMTSDDVNIPPNTYLVGNIPVTNPTNTLRINVAKTLTSLSAGNDGVDEVIENVFNSGDRFEFPNDNVDYSVTLTEVTGYYRLDSNVYKRETVLPWFNCYSFGNGLESDRIRDDFNAPTMNNGAKVSTTLSDYGKERRGASMIYSGIYNSTSGVNRLNEFNMAESITKDLNPSH